MEYNVDSLEKALREIRTSVLFDEKWYKRTYGIRKHDPAMHYLIEGWTRGCDPSPFFSTSGYLKANPDVAEAGVNPLVHWEEWGHREARRRGSVDLVALRKAHPELCNGYENRLGAPACDECLQCEMPVLRRAPLFRAGTGTYDGEVMAL